MKKIIEIDPETCDKLESRAKETGIGSVSDLLEAFAKNFFAPGCSATRDLVARAAD